MTRAGCSLRLSHTGRRAAAEGQSTWTTARAYDAFQEGLPAARASSPHAAVVALERARDLEPDKGSIRETLGRAYFRTGRFAAARAEFARAVEIDPVNDYALFGLGLSPAPRGRPQSAPAVR